VLFDNFDEAAQIMQDIGPKGEVVNEHAYLSWPIFREFRKTEQFAQAFLSVFEHNFVDAATNQIREQGNGESSKAPGSNAMPTSNSVEHVPSAPACVNESQGSAADTAGNSQSAGGVTDESPGRDA
jgi:hypothetical protein